MHKLLFACLSVSFLGSALASDSCSLLINVEELGMTNTEKAKLELYLKKKDFTLNKLPSIEGLVGGYGGGGMAGGYVAGGMAGGISGGGGMVGGNAGGGGVGSGYMANGYGGGWGQVVMPNHNYKLPKTYHLASSISLAGHDEDGKPLFKVTDHGLFQSEKAPVSKITKLKDLELAFIESQGLESHPVKILKPKRKFIFKEKGSDGYIAMKSILRDLPKCEKEENEIAVNDGDRSQEKSVPVYVNPYGGFGMGYSSGVAY